MQHVAVHQLVVQRRQAGHPVLVRATRLQQVEAVFAGLRQKDSTVRLFEEIHNLVRKLEVALLEDL
eukprot:8544323-Pyramimonas_sp.AAC.1